MIVVSAATRRIIPWVMVGASGWSAVAGFGLTTDRIVTGLDRPVFLTHAPGDSERLFVLEKRGLIRVLENRALLATPFLDIDAIVVGGNTNFGEQGLLGMAFHPDYSSNGRFYVHYTRNDGDSVVAGYSVSPDPDVADETTGQTVVVVGQPHQGHNGGWIGFGPDGYLYVAIGDGGNFGDTGTGHTEGIGNGQDTTDNLLGKMLRLDVDNDDFADPNVNYAIPSDNPFADPNDPRDDEIWAYGLRQPWRASFDRTTGDLWIADVGQASWEEINFQPAASGGGENYGWRCREGAHDFDTSGDCSQTPFTEPIHEYSHALGRCAVLGGYVYRGSDIPAIAGKYFYADYCAGEIFSLRYDGVSVTELVDHTAELGRGTQTVVSFGEDANGELYLCDQGNGEILKIVVAVSACPGDTDGDNDVDISDLGIVLAQFGTSGGGLQGDVNQDGAVDITDLGIVLANFGSACP